MDRGLSVSTLNSPHVHDHITRDEEKKDNALPTGGFHEHKELNYPGPIIPYSWKLVAHVRSKDPGANLRAVAAACGFSFQAVYQWVRKPQYQMYENWLLGKVTPELPPQVLEERRTVAQRLQEKYETHAEDMADRLLGILDTVEDPRLQKEIATDWLDRAGFSAPKNERKAGLSLSISEDTLKMFFDRAGECGLAATRPELEAEVVGSSEP